MGDSDGTKVFLIKQKESSIRIRIKQTFSKDFLPKDTEDRATTVLTVKLCRSLRTKWILIP